MKPELSSQQAREAQVLEMAQVKVGLSPSFEVSVSRTERSSWIFLALRIREWPLSAWLSE